MNEDFVTFELAKKLKEKGFPQRPDYCNYSSYYEWDGLRKIHSLSNASVWFDTNLSRDNIYFAATISQVLKWLRDKNAIHIEIKIWDRGWYSNVWVYEFYEEEKEYSIKFIHQSDDYESYEYAALAGIKYILDNLI
jgi:hypothetical protein